jgi:hypothetical protein
MIIIGSWALRQYNKAYRLNPADLDVMCSKVEMESLCQQWQLTPEHKEGPVWAAHNSPTYKHIEFHLTDGSPAAAAYCAYVEKHHVSYMIVGDVTIYASPLEVLYSLKRSHRHLPTHWEKNINDYHLLKGLVGNVDKIPELTKLKMQENKIIKTPSLNKSKMEFFNDDVSNKTFEHDEIHQVMAHRELPMFEYIKLDKDKVKCSEEKFNALTLEQRIQCVLEEAYVIALERAVIPMLYEGMKYATPESAFKWALMRICTTLCSGWFREFAVENYPAILASYNRDYVKKFLQAVDSGTIRRIDI